MATYNGAMYVREQLDSILKQTIPVDIFIRDDNSKDTTLEILDEYEKKYENVQIIRGVEGGGSSKKNFGILLNLEAVLAYDYIMCVDQDDIWFPKKVAETLEMLQSLENQYGKETPILVHTDVELIDEEGTKFASSFWRYNGFNPQYNSLARLLVDNTVTGTTMMVNSSLLQMARPIPGIASMHDAWLALTASAFGKIGIVHTPTMQYRQHSTNVIGAQGKENFFTKAKIAIQLTLFSEKRDVNISHRILEAQIFLERFADTLTPTQKEIVSTFAHIYSFSRIQRWIFLFRYGFYKQRVVKTLGLLLIWLLQKKS